MSERTRVSWLFQSVPPIFAESGYCFAKQFADNLGLGNPSRCAELHRGTHTNTAVEKAPKCVSRHYHQP